MVSLGVLMPLTPSSSLLGLRRKWGPWEPCRDTREERKATLHSCGDSTGKRWPTGTGDPWVLKRTLPLAPGMGSPGLSPSALTFWWITMVRGEENQGSPEPGPRPRVPSVCPQAASGTLVTHHPCCAACGSPHLNSSPCARLSPSSSPEVLKPPHTHSVQKELHLPCLLGSCLPSVCLK